MVARIDEREADPADDEARLGEARCLGVSPASTFLLPFREQTIPVIAQPTETIDDSPNEITSRPTRDEREARTRRRPARCPGTGGCGYAHWGGWPQPGGGAW